MKGQRFLENLRKLIAALGSKGIVAGAAGTTAAAAFATAVLAGASRLNVTFNPDNFAQFEEMAIESGVGSSASTGGQDSDLTDENADGEGRSDGQDSSNSDDSSDFDTPTLLNLRENDSGGSNENSIYLSEDNRGNSDTTENKEENHNTFSVSEETGTGGIAVTPETASAQTDNNETGSKGITTYVTAGSGGGGSSSGGGSTGGGSGSSSNGGGSTGNTDNSGKGTQSGDTTANTTDNTTDTSNQDKGNEQTQDNTGDDSPNKEPETDPAVTPEQQAENERKANALKELEGTDSDIYVNGKKLVSVRVTKNSDSDAWSDDTWYVCYNQAFNPDDIIVYAVYADDTYDTVSYGGKSGYTITWNTATTGTKYTRVEYRGVSSSLLSYKVSSASVAPKYHVVWSNGKSYYAVFPGTLIAVMPDEASKSVLNVILDTATHVGSDGYARLMPIHKRMIAYTGDSEMLSRLHSDTGTNCKYVTGLSVSSDGYLSTMLGGFNLQANTSSEYYINYPISKSSSSSLAIVDRVVEVDAAYLIKFVGHGNTEDKDSTYYADQVFTGYKGTDTAVSIPMGTTAIEIESGNEAINYDITSLIIPESVDTIDVPSIAENFKSLTAYEISTNSYYNYRTYGGALYSRDGTALISVPPALTELSDIPDTLTDINENAFLNSSITALELPESVTTLAAGAFNGYGGNGTTVLLDNSDISISGNTGLEPGTKILVPQSDDDQYDLGLKKLVMAFGKTGHTGLKFAAVDADGNETAEGMEYIYSDGCVWSASKDGTRVLELVPDSATDGVYTVPDGVTVIGGGAFLDNESAGEIAIPATVTELKAGSLRVNSCVKRIVFKGSTPPDVTEDTFDESCEPSIRVPDGAENAYLKAWGDILDGIYGEGAAKRIIKADTASYVRDGGVIYEAESTDDGETYTAVGVYNTGKSEYRLLDGTVAIESGVFTSCTEAENIWLPESLTTITEGEFADCTALEAVFVNNSDMDDLDIGDVPDDAEIYILGADNAGAASVAAETESASAGSDTDGNGYVAFELQEDSSANGVYGVTSAGELTLINVVTDYSGSFALKDETTAIGNAAFENCTELTDITDIESLVSIGDSAFDGCSSFTTGDFGAAPDLCSVGESAFKACSSLTEAVFPETVTKLQESTFYNCTELASFTGKLKSIGQAAFQSCNSLEALPDLSEVTSIGSYAFDLCGSLTEAVLPESITSIGSYAFRNCGNITSVEYNASTMAISAGCFQNCIKLSSISFGGGSTDSLFVIGAYSFENCHLLEEIDMSGLESEDGKQLGKRAFGDCSVLSDVILPPNMVSIGDRCFEGCDSISDIYFSGTTAPTSIGTKIFGDEPSGNMHFNSDEGVEDIFVAALSAVLDSEYGESYTQNCFDATEYVYDGIKYRKVDDGLELYEVPSDISGSITVNKKTVNIVDDAFNGRTGLTSIKLPYGSTMKLGDRAFYGCTGLTEAYIYSSIPEWGDSVFAGTALSTVYIGYDGTSQIDRIGDNAFKDVSSLNSLTLAGAIRSIGKYAFYGTSFVNIPTSADFRACLEEIDEYAFAGSRLGATTSGTASGLVGTTSTNLKIIGDYAFEGSSLKQISIPATVETLGIGIFKDCVDMQYCSFYGEISEYPKDMFNGCTSLLRTGGVAAALNALESIGESCYEGCTSLLFNSSWGLYKYPNLKSIGDKAFYGCSSITDTELDDGTYAATLGSSANQIGSEAFEGCTALKQIHMTYEPSDDVDDEPEETLANVADFVDDDGNAKIKIIVPASDEDEIFLKYLDLLCERGLTEDEALSILDTEGDDDAKETYINARDAAETALDKTAAELYAEGFTAEELKELGFTDEEIAEAITEVRKQEAATLYAEGKTIEELKELGYTDEELAELEEETEQETETAESTEAAGETTAAETETGTAGTEEVSGDASETEETSETKTGGEAETGESAEPSGADETSGENESSGMDETSGNGESSGNDGTSGTDTGESSDFDTENGTAADNTLTGGNDSTGGGTEPSGGDVDSSEEETKESTGESQEETGESTEQAGEENKESSDTEAEEQTEEETKEQTEADKEDNTEADSGDTEEDKEKDTEAQSED